MLKHIYLYLNFQGRGRKTSLRQLREPNMDEDIRKLQSQVTQISVECKALKLARDRSVVVAAQMTKEVERLEELIKSQRLLKDKGHKQATR